MKRKLIVGVFLYLSIISPVIGAGVDENIGIQTDVSAEINRSDYGFLQSIDVYCRAYQIGFCEDKVGLHNPVITLRAVHHYFFVDGEEWYQENVVESRNDSVAEIG